MKERTPIALLIGAGSRTVPLIEYAASPESLVEITVVVSHKKLSDGHDVVGIAKAKEKGIPTAYFNLVQMFASAQEIEPTLSKEEFRKQYFKILGAFLSQNYPHRPVAVFMLGWDLVVPEEFLKFFPSEKDGVYNVINLHPAQLPDEPEENEVTLSTGEKIPVLRGEHDKVIKEALRLKLPALGSCMHFAKPTADVGGGIIKRAEVPIYPDDTLETYDARLKLAEEQLVLEVIKMFAEGKIQTKHTHQE